MQSPADVIWNLRSITGKYLITNTITLPARIENRDGILELPEHAALFTPALRERERRILNRYYMSKFGWDLNGVAPDPADPQRHFEWIENDRFTAWPVWWLYSDHAFRSLLRLCRLRIVDEWKWMDHCLQVLCEISDEPIVASDEPDVLRNTSPPNASARQNLKIAYPERASRAALALVESVRRDTEFVSATFHRGLWKNLQHLEFAGGDLIKDDRANTSYSAYLAERLSMAFDDIILRAIEISRRETETPRSREKAKALAACLAEIVGES